MIYENNIDGYVVMPQLLWLKEQAEKMESIIEIGCWKGRSTHALASGCKGKIDTFDTFKGTAGEEEWFLDHDTSEEQCRNNLKEFKNIEVHRGTSDDAKELPQVDMVWIDADHSYEGVKKDILNLLPKAKKLICGHDIGRDCVARAVRETVGGHSNFDNIWFKWI